MKKNENGFSLVETILVIAVITLIGLCGYFVKNAQDAKKETAAAKASNSTAKPSTEVKTQYVVVKDNQKYLGIKEWGVRIPVNSITDSVVYAGGHYNIGGGSSPDDARLGLLSLGSNCSELPDASSAPLGWYVRFTKDEVDAENASQVTPGNTSLHELSKTAVQVPGSDGGYGAYYVAYAKPTSDCSNGGNTAAVNAAVTAFQQALKDIKSGD